MFGLNAKQITLLLLLVVALYAGSQIIPIYFNAFQFSDFVRQEVKFAGTAKRNVQDVKARIVKKAEEYDYPIGPREVRITRRGPAFNVEINYVVTLNLRVYQRDIAFHIFETGALFDK